MAIGKERITCGPICFALQYRDIDGARHTARALEAEAGIMPDARARRGRGQGV
jgi:hypothetical protein